MRVGQLHPLIGVGVDQEVPLVHLFRRDARQQGEVARHHETLNVVGVGQPLGFADHLRKAVHPRFAGPVEGGQRPLGLQRVGRRVVRHLQPVDAPDVLPPAQDLTDEALDRVEGRVAVAVGLFRPRA